MMDGSYSHTVGETQLAVQSVWGHTRGGILEVRRKLGQIKICPDWVKSGTFNVGVKLGTREVRAYKI